MSQQFIKLSGGTDNDNQLLGITCGTGGNDLSISGGNTITIPEDQYLRLTGSNLSILRSCDDTIVNTIALPGGVAAQTLSIVDTATGSDISISGGNTITTPDQTLAYVDNPNFPYDATLTITDGYNNTVNSVTIGHPTDLFTLAATGYFKFIGNANTFLSIEGFSGAATGSDFVPRVAPIDFTLQTVAYTQKNNPTAPNVPSFDIYVGNRNPGPWLPLTPTATFTLPAGSSQTGVFDLTTVIPGGIPLLQGQLMAVRETTTSSNWQSGLLAFY